MSAIGRATQAARKAQRMQTGEDRIPAAWRAEVTEITEEGAWVMVPRLTGDARHGPVDRLENLFLAVGDRVLVLMVEGRKDSPVVVGKLAR